MGAGAVLVLGEPVAVPGDLGVKPAAEAAWTQICALCSWVDMLIVGVVE